VFSGPSTFDSSPIPSKHDRKRVSAPVLRTYRSSPGLQSPRNEFATSSNGEASPLMSRRPFAVMSRLFESNDSSETPAVISTEAPDTNAALTTEAAIASELPSKSSPVGASSKEESPGSADSSSRRQGNSSSMPQAVSPLAIVMESGEEDFLDSDSESDDALSEKSGSITVIRSEKRVSPRVAGQRTPGSAVFTSPARDADRTGSSLGAGSSKHEYSGLTGDDDSLENEDKEDTQLRRTCVS
jgi:hypothetical protein